MIQHTEEPIREHAWLHLCEWLYENPDELPGPCNMPTGLRIMTHYTERTRPANDSLTRANQPSLFAWSTTEKVSVDELVSWALRCWAKVCNSHCLKVELKYATPEAEELHSRNAKLKPCFAL